MRTVRVSGLKEYRVKGKLYRYHRLSGTKIDASLTGQALAVEVARLDALHKPLAPKAGTLGSLLESYRKAPQFTRLMPRTVSDYLKCMDYLKPVADTPLTICTQGFFAKLRDKAVAKKRVGFTNHMLAMLSSAFSHGVEYELVPSNPLVGLTPAKMEADRKRPNRPWTPEERKNVIDAAPAQLRLPLLLARTWGLRRTDIAKLPLSAYRDGWLTFRAHKNDAPISLPVVGELKREIEAAIKAAPKGDAVLLCLNSRGKPWTLNGLSVSLDKHFKACRERGLMGDGGSLHGLRHSVAAEMRAAGYDKEMRKLVLGHDTDEMAEHYAASADMRGQLIDLAKTLDKRARKS